MSDCVYPWACSPVLRRFGSGLSNPSIQSLVTRFQAVAKSGTLLGFYQSARSLALILSPIWA
ncbi:MAG: hypothetical protein ACK2T5_18275 [Anaerolineales bacterium]